VYVRYFKRFCDLTLTLILLMILSWLFLLIWLCYLITLSFPVIFKQDRIGRNGAPFRLFKFRTLEASDLSAEQGKFWLGNLLRNSSLDELPQLINVLKGEMSLVGPRPLLVEYLPLFSEHQRKRHHVRPGITGWAQVNGRTSISWEKKFEYDLYYVENISWQLDVKILFRTVTLLLSMKKDSSLEEEKFMGNA